MMTSLRPWKFCGSLKPASGSAACGQEKKPNFFMALFAARLRLDRGGEVGLRPICN